MRYSEIIGGSLGATISVLTLACFPIRKSSENPELDYDFMCNVILPISIIVGALLGKYTVKGIGEIVKLGFHQRAETLQNKKNYSIFNPRRYFQSAKNLATYHFNEHLGDALAASIDRLDKGDIPSEGLEGIIANSSCLFFNSRLKSEKIDIAEKINHGLQTKLRLPSFLSRPIAGKLDKYVHNELASTLSAEIILPKLLKT